jgi:hypothetical protein
MKNINYYFTFYRDSAEYSQLNFPDTASPIAERLVFFHDEIMFLIILILVLVG